MADSHKRTSIDGENKQEQRFPKRNKSRGDGTWSSSVTANKNKTADEWWVDGQHYRDGETKDEKLCFDACLRAAELGHVKAMARVGICKEYGLGCEPDFKEALRWLERAAAQDSLDALEHLCSHYDMDSTTRLVQSKTSAQYTRKCIHRAQCRWMEWFPTLVDTHSGAPVDPMACFQKMAEEGNPYAQFSLYEAYQFGIGVPKNKELAQNWLKAAEAQEFPYALVITDEYYSNNPRILKAAATSALTAIHIAECMRRRYNRTSIEDIEYIRRLRHAISLGSIEAECLLKVYQSLDWYKSIADRGNVDAAELVFAYGDTWKVVRKYRELAAVGGACEAQHWLADMCARGTKHTPKDECKALQLYRAAASVGYKDSCLSLAKAYDTGTLGLTADKSMARRWYRLSLSNRQATMRTIGSVADAVLAGRFKAALVCQDGVKLSSVVQDIKMLFKTRRLEWTWVRFVECCRLWCTFPSIETVRGAFNTLMYLVDVVDNHNTTILTLQEKAALLVRDFLTSARHYQNPIEHLKCFISEPAVDMWKIRHTESNRTLLTVALGADVDPVDPDYVCLVLQCVPTRIDFDAVDNVTGLTASMLADEMTEDTHEVKTVKALVEATTEWYTGYRFAMTEAMGEVLVNTLPIELVEICEDFLCAPQRIDQQV